MSLLLAETTVSTIGVTTVTFSGLDGNTHGGYVLTADMASGTGSLVKLYVENDTTAGNYAAERFYATGTSVAADVPTTPDFAYIAGGVPHSIVANLGISGGYISCYSAYTEYNGTTLYVLNRATRYKTSVSNLTRIDIVTPNEYSTGSVFRLYRRK